MEMSIGSDFMSKFELCIQCSCSSQSTTYARGLGLNLRGSRNPIARGGHDFDDDRFPCCCSNASAGPSRRRDWCVMEGGTTVIEFGTALDFLAFEKIISQRARELTILEYDQYVFDCSYLQWAGIFQLSILYGWLRELRSQNKRVEIRPPRLGTEASNFLSSTSFLAELQSIGCDVPISQGSRPDRLGLTTFKTFDSRGSLAAYEEALGDPQRITALLGGAADTPLVREGVFRTVLVHELCENAFIHGNGEAVRYAVSMHSRSSARKPHKVLASFDGAPYLEIVVSDDGPD
jgi:hypothetical protein